MHADLNWKQELSKSYTSLQNLLDAGLLSAEEATQLGRVEKNFKIRITPYYASLFENSKDCPIRKQSLPGPLEEGPELPAWAEALSQKIYQRSAPWHRDAIGDVENLASPRITHRYENRAILHLSSMCAVYCRFCFRKSHLNDPEKTLYDGTLDAAFEYLGKAPSIRELILTGGDPLSLTDAALLQIFRRISSISHIRVVRIHSRMAVTLPHRFTQELIALLKKEWGFQVVLVSHFNHVAELTPLAKEASNRVKKAGITQLNQSVLLKGVNTSVQALRDLFQELYEIGIIPYYLHHPDWTPGTFHFRTSIEEGKTILEALRGLLPGPAIPDYILDIPHGFGKVSLLGSQVKKVQSVGDTNLQGAVYELTAPQTRFPQSKSKHLYLDLWF